MISIRLLFRSFKNAWHGLCDVASAEQGFRIQLMVGGTVLFCALILPLQVWERILLFLLTVSVLVLEIVNSIFERLADAVHPRLHPMVRQVKDMMAGAVLLVAVTSVIVGFVIMFPPILAMFCEGAFSGVLGSWCA
jgi:undecaprenol kinase